MLWQAEEMTPMWMSQDLRLGGLHLWVTLIFVQAARNLFKQPEHLSSLKNDVISHSASFQRKPHYGKKVLLQPASLRAHCCCKSHTHIFGRKR